MRCVQKVSSLVIRKIETFIEEDTTYKKHCTQDNDTSVPLKVVTLGPHTVLPVATSCPIIFSWISSTAEISSLSKVILVWGKAGSHRARNLGCNRGWVTWVIWCFGKTLHETWCMSRDVVVMKLLIISGLWLWPLNHLDSFCGGMNLQA